MQSSHTEEVRQICLYGCCPTILLNLPETRSTASAPRSTFSVSRRDFTTTTTSSIFPNTRFTNHESLPSLQESYEEFTKVYPRHGETDQIDHIRSQKYYHLQHRNHTCLDYIGIGLFSYSQLHYHDSPVSQAASSSQAPPRSDFPFFTISYKTGSLKTQLLLGGQGSELEAAMKKRVMSFLNISESEYCMVFTANRTSAFKLLAESYPFQSSRKLLSVYDYESEAMDAMISSSEKKGARIMSAEFSWPRLKIQATKLRKMIVSKKKKKEKKRGLFVFPVHSRVTGSRYPYLWMSLAQENGWHVLLDACSLGPKDMDSFGLSLFRPDFIICSFYKVFGENPSGFGCLFVKRSSVPIMDASSSVGIVSLVPGKKVLKMPDESSGAVIELEEASATAFGLPDDEIDTSNSFSGRIIAQSPTKVPEQGGSDINSEAVRPEEGNVMLKNAEKENKREALDITCHGLDQVESLGMMQVGNRGRFLINWLVNALLKFEHPNTEGARLVKIYGPKIKFDRGPALAFNVFDWKGEKVDPVLVQKLADRSNISLSYAFLQHIYFSNKYEDEKARALENRSIAVTGTVTNKKKGRSDQGVRVVTLALSFLSNFEDVYRIWAFVAQFLDADFVEKERWRYTALNQKMIEI